LQDSSENSSLQHGAIALQLLATKPVGMAKVVAVEEEAAVEDEAEGVGVVGQEAVEVVRVSQGLRMTKAHRFQDRGKRRTRARVRITIGKRNEERRWLEQVSRGS
jgi:hypothetical protein